MKLRAITGFQTPQLWAANFQLIIIGPFFKRAGHFLVTGPLPVEWRVSVTHKLISLATVGQSDLPKLMQFIKSKTCVTGQSPIFQSLFIPPVCNSFFLFQLNHLICTMLQFISAFYNTSRWGFKKRFAVHLLVILITFICVLFYFARGFPNRMVFSLKSWITFEARNCDLLVLEWFYRNFRNFLYFF